MTTRWLPTDRTLRRALLGIATWAVCAATALTLGLVVEAQEDWPGRDLEPLLQSVVLNGAGSQETTAVVKRLGEELGSGTVLAVLNPATRQAVAAYPETLTGKKPEEMTTADGRQMPLPYSTMFGNVGVHRAAARAQVWITPIRPFTQVVPVVPRPPGLTFQPNLRYPYLWEEYRSPSQVIPKEPLPTVPEPTSPELHAWLLLARPTPYVGTMRIVQTVLAALAGLGLLAYWLSIAWWVYTDARARRQNALAWGLAALATNLIGLLVYLLFGRRAGRNCPGCGAATDQGYAFCPTCGRQLKHTCDRCGHELHGGWAYCAQCGSPKTSAAAQ